MCDRNVAATARRAQGATVCQLFALASTGASNNKGGAREAALAALRAVTVAMRCRVCPRVSAHLLVHDVDDVGTGSVPPPPVAEELRDLVHADFEMRVLRGNDQADAVDLQSERHVPQAGASVPSATQREACTTEQGRDLQRKAPTFNAQRGLSAPSMRLPASRK